MVPCMSGDDVGGVKGGGGRSVKIWLWLWWGENKAGPWAFNSCLINLHQSDLAQTRSDSVISPSQNQPTLLFTPQWTHCHFCHWLPWAESALHEAAVRMEDEDKDALACIFITRELLTTYNLPPRTVGLIWSLVKAPLSALTLTDWLNCIFSLVSFPWNWRERAEKSARYTALGIQQENIIIFLKTRKEVGIITAFA